MLLGGMPLPTRGAKANSMLLDVLACAGLSCGGVLTCLQRSLERSTAADSSDERIERDHANAHRARAAVIGYHTSVVFEGFGRRDVT